MKKGCAGIIGTGFIAQVHAQAIAGIEGVEAAGVSGRDPARTKAFADRFGMPAFGTVEELLRDARPDYVVICTPHPSHMEIARAALEFGVHVFVEKPLCIRRSEAEPVIALAKERGLQFGVNFQMRIKPERRRMLEIIASGGIGDPVRVTLQATAWFRSQAYYAANPWRGTWNGEGGGVLTNQGPHDLDLLVLAVGLPSRVLAEINSSGHRIEVEDEAVAICAWPSGAIGTLHLSTREAPGNNSFEIAGTRGTLHLEGDELTWVSLRDDSREFSDTTTETMKQPSVAEVSKTKIADSADRYRLMHLNFMEAINGVAPLICSAESGLKQVIFSNALLLSALERGWVETPAPDAKVDSTYRILAASPSIAAALISLKASNL